MTQRPRSDQFLSAPEQNSPTTHHSVANREPPRVSQNASQSILASRCARKLRVRWPIRNQILVPFTLTLALSVAGIAITAAWLAALRQEKETSSQLQRVVATLGGANFPYTANVLEQMRGLSGAEFALLDNSNHVIASTIPQSLLPHQLPNIPLVRDVDSFTAFSSLTISETDYLAARVRAKPSTSLLVLYPEQRRTDARREAAWPPLAVGTATAAVMISVSLWLSRRIGRRVDTVRALFARIAGGDFSHAEAVPPNDELHDLILSANQLSDQLRSLQQTIRHTERIRLLGQLAGGLAHQLRNSLTGARMAVQLHQRRCPRTTGDDDLEVALLQLALTEEQVKGLLALGRRAEGTTTTGTLGNLLNEVERLVGPTCRHARVAWQCTISDDASDIELEHYEQLRTALLNLTLNAIEAAGTHGHVSIQASDTATEVTIEVSDNGPGPPASLQDSLFEPFVTAKPEGIGLGLALARQAAEEVGGSLHWHRQNGLTLFSLQLPRIKRTTFETGNALESSRAKAQMLDRICPAAGDPRPASLIASQPRKPE